MSKKDERPRLTRAEAEPMVIEIEAALFSQGVDYELGGSWRRGKETVADLDIAIFSQPANSIDLAVDWSRSGPQMASGDFAYTGDRVLQVDLWGTLDRATQLGAFMWFVTGPKELNIAMRSIAQRKGLTLSQYGVFQNGEQIDDGTETGVAEVLGWPWIEPTDRDNWRTHRS